eukprot:gene14450-biopygen169
MPFPEERSSISLRFTRADPARTVCHIGEQRQKAIGLQEQELAPSIGPHIAAPTEEFSDAQKDSLAILEQAAMRRASLPSVEQQGVGESEDVVVTLTRKTFEQWLPWGFVLDDDTMVLLSPATGSIAAASSELRACVGMVLVEVDSIIVHSRQDVKFATTFPDNTITLHFISGKQRQSQMPSVEASTEKQRSLQEAASTQLAMKGIPRDDHREEHHGGEAFKRHLRHVRHFTTLHDTLRHKRHKRHSPQNYSTVL